MSLGASPRLLKEIYNQQAAAFVRDSSGKIEIRTSDGQFDYLFLSHAESPLPAVYLRLVGTRLIDVGYEHIPDYDKEIAQAKGELDPEELSDFRSAPIGDPRYVSDSNRRTEATILQIICAYLYSGRATKAHKALNEMWPVFDQEAAWKKILEARRRGILKNTGRKHS